MQNLEKQFSQVNSVIDSLKVALELCGNSSLMMEGVVTTALNSATALHAMMLDSLGWSSMSPWGPEGDEDGEDDDSSWMDDMEATRVAPV
jgi:hypothetical protein